MHQDEVNGHYILCPSWCFTRILLQSHPSRISLSISWVYHIRQSRSHALPCREKGVSPSPAEIHLHATLTSFSLRTDVVSQGVVTVNEEDTNWADTVRNFPSRWRSYLGEMQMRDWSLVCSQRKPRHPTRRPTKEHNDRLMSMRFRLHLLANDMPPSSAPMHPQWPIPRK